MFQVAREDVLKGLKGFKRLAKQDLLAAGLTDNPSFWENQATARRSVYDRLIALVDQESVEDAYDWAVDAYRGLPFLTGADNIALPDIKGQEQALEMFFMILGIDKRTLREVRSQRESLAEQATLVQTP